MQIRKHVFTPAPGYLTKLTVGLTPNTYTPPALCKALQLYTHSEMDYH